MVNMKYLSILSVLLLIGGNFSCAMENDQQAQDSKMTLKDKIKHLKENRNRMENQNNDEPKTNDARAKVHEMEKKHRRGRLRTAQQEPTFENNGTVNVDGKTIEF